MGMPLAPCSIFVGKMISAPGVLAKLFFQEGPEGPPAPPETTRPANPLRRARPDARPHRPSARPSIRVRLPAAPSQPLSAYLDFFSKQLFASRRLLFISPPHRRVAQRCDPLLGNSSTVERRTLTPLILVRIQVPQPISSFSLYFRGLIGRPKTGTDFRITFPDHADPRLASGHALDQHLPLVTSRKSRSR